jgi:hypothetical protein
VTGRTESTLRSIDLGKSISTLPYAGWGPRGDSGFERAVCELSQPVKDQKSSSVSLFPCRLWNKSGYSGCPRGYSNQFYGHESLTRDKGYHRLHADPMLGRWRRSPNYPSSFYLLLLWVKKINGVVACIASTINASARSAGIAIGKATHGWDSRIPYCMVTVFWRVSGCHFRRCPASTMGTLEAMSSRIKALSAPFTL